MNNDREAIATRLYNLGHSWPAAWAAADAELAARQNVANYGYPQFNPGAVAFAHDVMQQMAQRNETGGEEMASSRTLYYIRTESDELTQDGVTEPKRIEKAAKIAVLIRKIRAMVPGARVDIQIPGVPPSVMAYLVNHINDELTIIDEDGEMFGEPFVPSYQNGTMQQKELARGDGVPFIPATASATEGEADGGY